MIPNDLEKKEEQQFYQNTAVSYKDIKINIVDTPGHADLVRGRKST